MPDFALPIEPIFIALTIVAIFVLVGIGIIFVKKFKQTT